MKAGRLFVKTPRDVVWPGDPVRGDADIDAAGLEDIENVVNLLKRIIRMQMLHQLVAVGHVYRVALRGDAAAIRDDQREICRDIRHIRDLGRDINRSTRAACRQTSNESAQSPGPISRKVCPGRRNRPMKRAADPLHVERIPGKP